MKILFYIRKSEASSRGIATIYMRITVKGKRSEVSTQKQVHVNDWDSTKNKTKYDHEINRYLESCRSKLIAEERRLLELGKAVTAQVLKNEFTGRSDRNKGLLEASKQKLDMVKESIGNGYTKTTYTKYYTAYNHLREFIRHEFNGEDISLKSIKYSFITDYRHFLMNVTTINKPKKMSNNSANNSLKKLITIINDAVKNDWIPRSPFIGFKMKVEEMETVYLEAHELQALEQKEFDIMRIERVRDVFVFGCYTGASFSDVKKMNKDNIVIDSKGDMWIEYNRKKNGNKAMLPLHPKARVLIDKYADHPLCVNQGVLLPVISNQKTNLYLKEIADVCGINKVLTSHVQRHSYATLKMEEGFRGEILSKTMGQTDSRSIKRYSHVNRNSIKEEHDRVKRFSS